MPRITAGSLPATIDLAIYAGDDFYLNVVVTDAEGAPLDLTGFTPKAQIRRSTSSEEVAAEFVAAIVDNVVQLDLHHDVTAELTGGCWDVQLSDASSVTTLAYGNVRVVREVTR